MNRFRRLPVFLLASLAAAWMALPLTAATAILGQRLAPQTEEKSEENRSEEQRSDANAAVAFASADRSRHGRGSRVLPPLTTAPTFGHHTSTSFHPASQNPRTESGHTLRNGLGTFYRC